MLIEATKAAERIGGGPNATARAADPSLEWCRAVEGLRISHANIRLFGRTADSVVVGTLDRRSIFVPPAASPKRARALFIHTEKQSTRVQPSPHLESRCRPLATPL